MNNIVLSVAPFQSRVLFGYMISFTTLIFVAVCEVAWHMFATNTAYLVNMSAVALTAIGCTVQQSSFYGFASMLPKQYTQAVMAGESIAGFLVSSNRVVTKLLINNDRVSTVIFFLTSTLYILFSYLLHVATINSPFVRFHVEACSKIVLRPDEVSVLTKTCIFLKDKRLHVNCYVGNTRSMEVALSQKQKKNNLKFNTTWKLKYAFLCAI